MSKTGRKRRQEKSGTQKLQIQKLQNQELQMQRRNKKMYLKSKTSENLRSGRTKRGAALLLAGMFALSAAGCSSPQSSSQKSS